MIGIRNAYISMPKCIGCYLQDDCSVISYCGTRPQQIISFYSCGVRVISYLCLLKTKALISFNGCKLKSMIVAGKCQMYVVPVICLFFLKFILFHYTAQLCITRGWPCKLPFPNSLLNWDTLTGYLMVIRWKISGYFFLLFLSLAVAASFMVPAPTRQPLLCGPS